MNVLGIGSGRKNGNSTQTEIYEKGGVWIELQLAKLSVPVRNSTVQTLRGELA